MARTWKRITPSGKIKDEYELLNDNAQYGEELEVRVDDHDTRITDAQNTADAAQITATAAETATQDLQSQINELVIEGDSSVEAAQARVSAPKGETFTTLKDRLDAGEQDVIDLRSGGGMIASDLAVRLIRGEITKIKLIGDSITEGVGAVGHISPPPDTQPVIFDNGDEVHYEGGYTERSYANLFRDFVAAHWPEVEFINAGIGGKDTAFAATNKEYWVDEDEDVVVVMLGTNDRASSESMEDTRDNLVEFLGYCAERCNTLIVMTANPTGNDGTEPYTYGMDDIDRVVTGVCADYGYPHISLYREMCGYTELSGTTLRQLLYLYGSHPNDRGYMVMWKVMSQRLGLLDVAAGWAVGSFNNVHVNIGDDVSGAPLLSTTPVTDAVFATGKHTYYELTSNSDPANWPGATTGTTMTYKGAQNDLHSRQEYHTRQSIAEYKRFWNFSGGAWSAWAQYAMVATRKDVSITPGSIGAGATVDVLVFVAGMDTVGRQTMVDLAGPLPAGIMATTWTDTAANRIKVRFHNTTGSPITVPALTARVIQFQIALM